MKNLTNKQIKTITTLVRLGDSLELAIKTVISQKQISKEGYEIYYNAYNL